MYYISTVSYFLHTKFMESEQSLKGDFLNLMISCLFMSRFCMLMDNVKLHAVFQ